LVCIIIAIFVFISGVHVTPGRFLRISWILFLGRARCGVRFLKISLCHWG
jgi:hypothetical protein